MFVDFILWSVENPDFVWGRKITPVLAEKKKKKKKQK